MNRMPAPDYDVADLPGERWLPAPGYEDSYEVSSLGRVKSLSRPGYRTRRPRILRQHTRSGYKSVCLYRKAKQQRVPIHRLVLTAFVGPPPEGYYGCHRDDVRSNNALSNLYWGTPSENQFDIVRLGNHSEARKTHCRNGHEFTESNIYRRKAYPQARYCLACRKVWERQRLDREMAARRMAKVAK